MDHSSIHDALTRILASPAFRKSKRGSELLNYIVREHLEGRADQILGTSIAQDVLGRDESFDSNTDPIVRVQMGRLRSMLNAYYHNEGAEDPLVITIPKGRYAPKFEMRVAPEVKFTATQSSKNTISIEDATVKTETGQFIWWPLRRDALWVLSLVAISAIVLIGVNMSIRQSSPELSVPSGPRVWVSEFSFGGDAELADVFPTGFQIGLIDRLSRFKNIFVYGPYTSFDEDGQSVVRADTNSQGPEFILTGSIDLAGDRLRVTSQLFNVSDSVVVWSGSIENVVANPSEINEASEAIVSEVAATLGQPYGVIESYLKRNVADLEGLLFGDYICVLRFYEYARRKTEPEHAKVRDCLEVATTNSPNYSDAWAALSWIYGDEERYGFNRLTDAQAPMERALKAAQTAVMTDPYNSTAHEYLAVVLFAQGKVEGFQQSVEMALDLNPNNSEALASAGHLMQMLENSEDGNLMSEKALNLNPGHPPWFHIGPALYHYRNGNYEESYYHATAFSQDNSALSKILLICSSVRSGMDDEAISSWMDLVDTYQEVANDPGAMLRSRQFSEPLIEKINVDLLAAQALAESA